MLSTLRGLERFVIGQGLMMALQQVVICAVCVYFAWRSLKRAGAPRTQADPGTTPPGR